MTPPVVAPNNQHCSEEIREVPLPHDECSEPIPDWRPAGERYRRLSINWDHSFPIPLPDPEFNYRMGIGVIGRPFDYTPLGVWGFGAQVSVNLNSRDDLVALGRVQTSFNLQRYGRERLTLAALGGIRHMFGRSIIPEGMTDPQNITGTLGVLGGEVALESRLFRWMTLVPYLGFQYTFGGEVQNDAGGPPLQIGPQYDFILGARFAFDIFPVGE